MKLTPMMFAHLKEGEQFILADEKGEADAYRYVMVKLPEHLILRDKGLQKQNALNTGNPTHLLLVSVQELVYKLDREAKLEIQVTA